MGAGRGGSRPDNHGDSPAPGAGKPAVNGESSEPCVSGGGGAPKEQREPRRGGGRPPTRNGLPPKGASPAANDAPGKGSKSGGQNGGQNQAAKNVKQEQIVNGEQSV